MKISDRINLTIWEQKGRWCAISGIDHVLCLMVGDTAHHKWVLNLKDTF